MSNIALQTRKVRGIFQDRIAHMCDNAGPWGKTLQSVIALGYAYAAFVKYRPFFDSIGPLDELMSENTVGLCFVCMAVVPLVAYLVDILWARIVATSLLILAWTTVFLAGSQVTPPLRPVQWVSIACIMAALNAERLIAREAMERYVARHHTK